MSIAQVYASAAPGAGAQAPVAGTSARPLHRIGAVRRQQGISLRSAARRMEMDASTLRRLEEADSDMPLSVLYRWQQALDVPVADLLVDRDDPLSEPILRRARLLRLMKTAAALRERADSAPIERLADMLIDQLVEIMPELKEVSAWHTVGQRRSLDELGRIAEEPVSEDWFYSANS